MKTQINDTEVPYCSKIIVSTAEPYIVLNQDKDEICISKTQFKKIILLITAAANELHFMDV